MIAPRHPRRMRRTGGEISHVADARCDAGIGAAGTIEERIAEGARMRRLAAGETLFRQGDSAHAIFLVAGGRVQLLRDSPGGRRVVLHDARPGELLAEAALFAPAYHCDAAAATAAQVRVVAKADLLARMRADPALVLGFAAMLARRVQGLRARVALRDLRPARERVLAGLGLYLNSDLTVALPGTLRDFAAEIGLTHEALYRTLAALAREGRIVRAGGAIRMIQVIEGPASAPLSSSPSPGRERPG